MGSLLDPITALFGTFEGLVEAFLSFVGDDLIDSGVLTSDRG